MLVNKLVLALCLGYFGAASGGSKITCMNTGWKPIPGVKVVSLGEFDESQQKQIAAGIESMCQKGYFLDEQGQVNYVSERQITGQIGRFRNTAVPPAKMRRITKLREKMEKYTALSYKGLLMATPYEEMLAFSHNQGQMIITRLVYRDKNNKIQITRETVNRTVAGYPAIYMSSINAKKQRVSVVQLVTEEAFYAVELHSANAAYSPEKMLFTMITLLLS